MIFRNVYYLQKAIKDQYKPLKQLVNLQNKKLRFLLMYVYKNNKFYHDLYKESNIDISKINSMEDLTKLPIISKGDIQQYCDLYLKTKKDKYLQNHLYGNKIVRRTGGSTGKPLFVLFNKRSWDFSEAIYSRSLFGAGYKPYEKLIVSNPFLEPKKRWFTYLSLFRKEHIQIEAPIDKQANKLLNQKTHFTFYSYPTILKLISEKIKNKKLKINRIISTAELLTASTKKKIEESFNCKVYNHYGSMEFNRIAWECKKREGLHMDIDSLAIEFIKDNEHVSFNERGKIIITNLNNFFFPLIRYDQGDVGIPIEHKCSCGRSLPLIKELLGRDNDFIMLKNKELLSPITFDVALSKFSEILQFKLVQKKIDRFDLFIIKSKNFSDRIKEKVEDNLKKILKSDNIDINYKFVNDIQRSSGGKLRSIVSNIS